MRRASSATFWPRYLGKLLNLKEDTGQFSADEDNDEEQDPEDSKEYMRALQRFSESAISRTHFRYTEEFSVFVGTWNVAGKRPPQDMDLKQWLDTGKEMDIYVIGFQEVVPLNSGNVFGSEDEGPASLWETLIRRTLNGDTRQTRSAPGSPRRQDDAVAAEDEAEKRLSHKRGHRKAHSTSELIFHDEKTAGSFSTSSLDRQQQENGKSYVRIISKQMVGILITVWVRKALRRDVHDVQVSCVGCGLMGYYGNKGSVSVSMMLEETSFCFICSHLSSGQKEADELHRNADVEYILRRTCFPRRPGQRCPERVLSHDRLIWLGDLNYRLSMPNADAELLVRNESWDALLKKDQLKLQQGAGGVFSGWQEGGIDFAPTYKYRMNSIEYSNSGENQRTPAWCDRILWHGNGLKLVDYFRTEYTFSDHRPVTAIFVAEASWSARGFIDRKQLSRDRAQRRKRRLSEGVPWYCFHVDRLFFRFSAEAVAQSVLRENAQRRSMAMLKLTNHTHKDAK